MPLPQPRPLLITSRPDFAQHVAGYAPDVDLATAAPDTVSTHTWATASAVFVDVQAVPTLRSRGLPQNRRTYVVTDTHPVGQDWANAVALYAIRLAWLPDAGPWLASTLQAAARRPPVIAVVGAGPDGTDTATIVALAMALDHLDRDEHVALVGLRPDPTTLHRQLDTNSRDTDPGPLRLGRLAVLTRTGQQPTGISETSSLIAGLCDAHDVIILDVPPPPNPAGSEALADADITLAVATPDELRRPDLAELTSAMSDPVRLAIVATDPDIANHQATTVGVGNVHTITPPGTDLTSWITDPAFRQQCSTAAGPTNTAEPSPPERSTTACRPSTSTA